MRQGMKRLFGPQVLDAWMLAAMTVGAIIIFWGLEPSWMNGDTLQSIITSNGPLAIVAMAMTFSIISRNIDLSPGAMIALSAVVAGLVFEHDHNQLLAAAAALGVCLVAAVFNGLLVSRLGLNAIMVTLATYIWARGLAYGFTNGNPIPVVTGLTSAMNQTFAGFTVVFPIVVVVFVLLWHLLTHTRFGRYTRAMGGDPEAARRSGIRVERYTLLIFALMGAATWLASMLIVAQLQSAQPSAAVGFEFDAIVAVIIGGTRLAGEGTVGRTLLGVAFISVLDSGLTNLGLSGAYYDIYNGGALLLVLALQSVLRRRAEREILVRQDLEQVLAEASG